MKAYKIKLMGADLYIKAIYFDTTDGEVKLGIIPSFDDEVAIYEEDKAKKYCEELNKQNKEIQFILEEVEIIERTKK